MEPKSTIVALSICIILILLLVFWNNIKKTKTYKQTKAWAYREFMRFPPNEALERIAWDGFLLFSTFTISIKLVSISGVVTVNDVWITTLILALAFLIFAIIVRLRIREANKTQPKQPDLGAEVQKLIPEIRKMINAINKMRESVDRHNELNKPKDIER